MKKNYFLTLVLAGVLFNVSAQQAPQALWNDQAKPATAEQANRTWLPLHYRYVHLDIAAMKNILATAPDELNTAIKNSTFIIELPMPDGGFQSFKIVYSPFMHRDLAAVYPGIKTFTGQGIDDVTATIKCDYTEFGFHAYILSDKGTVYIDPVNLTSHDDYLVYFKHDIGQPRNFTCELEDDPTSIKSLEALKAGGISSTQNIGSDLRTYRLALGCTHQYAQQFGTTKASVLAEMNTAMNRINGVYERELCIHMTLVPNDTVLIWLTSTGDPYTNSSGGAMLTENQTQCTSLIGTTNYDIGHVFSTGGGGVAGLGVVCNSSQKARGVTGIPATPPPGTTGDGFWIDYVAHEMGHQFGGNHTFNSVTSNCGGNRSANAAYEPGSGITIMAYAGICGSDDLAPHSIATFHTKSFDEIVTFSQSGTGNTCPVVSPTGNNAPTLTVQSNFTIPYKTPFRLVASGTDPDGDTVRFSWEEYDLGAAGTWNAPSGTAPIFRSYDPVLSGTRLCPRLSNILAAVVNGAAASKGELMPDYARTVKFRCTTRDNKAGGGGVIHNTTLVQLTAVNTGSGFAVTAPNTTGISWPALSWQTITWNVAGSTANGINCANVNIWLSTDSGQTFPYLQASNVPNTGSYSCNILNQQSTTCRMMIEGAGNVFFDINDKDFTIGVPTGINENELSHYISVYPNPSDNIFSFAINNNKITGKVNIEVYDATGRKATEVVADVFGSDNIINVDMNGFAKGIYQAVIKTGQGTLTQKLVKY
ncbi:MAG: reprolysin-like metallopeptidase [Bacteroidia bacterium]